MPNRVKKPEDRKDSITLAITNKVHLKFKIIADMRDKYWSHEVEAFMKEYNEKYEQDYQDYLKGHKVRDY